MHFQVITKSVPFSQNVENAACAGIAGASHKYHSKLIDLINIQSTQRAPHPNNFARSFRPALGMTQSAKSP
jgi:hypothetical protein